MASAHNRHDLVDLRFGRLLVVAYSHTSASRKAYWVCSCDCGKETTVQGQKLRNGHTSSCGCWKAESCTDNLSKRLVHGGAGTRTYKSWDAAKQRCFNPNDDHFPAYGGAGITMCDRWRESFAAFLDDMGQRPAGKTLDRFPNPRGNYEPGNCRWATPVEQANNRKHPRKRKHSTVVA